jgi:DNA-binding response OmpR family regulator
VRVLVIEDDDAIAAPLAAGLEREGFEVRRVATGVEALEADGPDVVLLDLGLPDVDGFELCRQLRSRSDVPILVISARGEEVDRVVGLELGADDYLVKPFGFRELVARICAVTRRANATAELTRPQHIGALELDRRTRRVKVAGAEVALTPKEFDLLACLAKEPHGRHPPGAARRRVGPALVRAVSHDRRPRCVGAQEAGGPALGGDRPRRRLPPRRRLVMVTRP